MAIYINFNFNIHPGALISRASFLEATAVTALRKKHGPRENAMGEVLLLSLCLSPSNITYLALLCLILPYLALSCLAASCLALSSPALPYLTLPCLAMSCLVLSYLILTYLFKPLIKNSPPYYTILLILPNLRPALLLYAQYNSLDLNMCHLTNGYSDDTV